MTDDELRALCESNAQAIAATNEGIREIRTQQATNTANIGDLIELSGNVLQAAQLNAEASAELKVSAAESDTRFNLLISEMRADRRATRQAFQALLL